MILSNHKCFLFISIITISYACASLRNPFEFGTEKPKEEIKQVVDTSEALAQWNIKEIGNDLVIMETDEGQIRTIQFSSF